VIGAGGSMRSMAALAGLVAVYACSGIGGCAAGGAAPAANESKDRVTASDESDASKRARVRMELASGYFERGQMNTALDQVKLAIAADPGFAEAFNLRGLIYANLGDEKLAEESFRRALQLNPQDADTMQNFGYFLCQKKRYGESTALFDQALAVPQYRDAGRTLFAKGVCLAVAGQLGEAEAALIRAYEVEPANPSISVNLSEVLYRQSQYERARFFIRRVNAVPAAANAQTLWLAMRIENRIGNAAGVRELGDQLLRRYPESRELALFRRGGFDE
jgi:type IV pilus assembly protein PilF